MAVTMVSTDGDQSGNLAISVVLLVVLSLGEPYKGGEGSEAPGDIDRSCLRARLSAL